MLFASVPRHRQSLEAMARLLLHVHAEILDLREDPDHKEGSRPSPSDTRRRPTPPQRVTSASITQEVRVSQSVIVFLFMFLFVFLLFAFLLVRNTANNIKRTGATDFRSVPFPLFSETVTNPIFLFVCLFVFYWPFKFSPQTH
jgi:hypothetical protein